MGSKTKSWLALALVIAMLFGMAVPTAFAANVDPYADIYFGASGSATTGPYSINKLAVGGAAQKVSVRNGQSGSVFNYFNNGWDDFDVQIDNPGSSYFTVALDKTVGQLVVTAKAATTEVVTVGIRISGLSASTFQSSTFSGSSKIYEGEIKVSYIPQIKPVYDTLMLDLNPESKITQAQTALNAVGTLKDITEDSTNSSFRTATYTFTKVDGTTYTGSDVRNGSNGCPIAVTLANGILRIVPASTTNVTNVAEGVLTIDGARIGRSVGSQSPVESAQAFSVNVKVQNSQYSLNKASYVKVDPSTITVRRDYAFLQELKFTATVVNAQGVAIDNQDLPQLGTIVPATAGLTATRKNLSNEYTIALPLNLGGSLSRTIVIPSGISGVLPGVVKLNITPVKMTTTTEKLVFERDLLGDTTITKNVNFSIVDGGTFSNSTEKYAFGISPNGSLPNGAFSAQHLGNGQWKVVATVAQLPSAFEGEFEFTNYAQTEEGPVEIETYVVPFEIVDKTAQPSVELSESAITIDLKNRIPNDSYGIFVNVNPTSDNDRILTLSATSADTTVAQVESVTRTGGTGSDRVNKVLIRGYVPGKTTVTVRGTYKVNDFTTVPFEKTVEVTVMNSTTNAPNSIRLLDGAESTINLGLKDVNFGFNVALFDVNGQQITPTNYPNTNMGDKKFVAKIETIYGQKIGTDIVKFTDGSNPKSSEMYFSGSRVSAGLANIRVRYLNNLGQDVAQPLLLKVNVAAAAIKVTPETLNLDLNDDKNYKATVTVMNDSGTAAELLSSLAVDQAYASGVVSIKAEGQGVYTVEAKKAGTTRLKATATLDGVDTAAKYVDVTVVDDAKLTANVSQMKFIRSSETGKSVAVVLGSNIAYAAVHATKVTVDPADALLVEGTGNNWKFTALKAAQGTVTFEGTVTPVGGAARTAAPLTLSFTSIDDVLVPELTLAVTPNSFKVAETADVAHTLKNVDNADSVVVTYTLGNEEVATYDAATKKLTGVKAGAGTITASCTIDSKEYTATANFTVAETPVDDSFLGLRLSDGTIALPGTSIADATPMFVNLVEPAFAAGETKLGNKVAITSIVSGKYGKSNTNTTSKMKNGSISNTVFAASPRDGLMYYKPKGIGYWMVELLMGDGVTRSFYFKNTDGTPDSITVDSHINLHAGERFDLRGAITVSPVGANKNSLKYATNNKSVVSPTVTGILKCGIPGEAKIQIKNKKGVVLGTVTVTVDSDYRKINFASAYFFQDKNSQLEDVKTILGAAQFSNESTTHAPVDVTSSTALEFKAKLAGLASTHTNLDRDDIFAFYFSGNVYQKGIKFADGTVATFDELAVAAGQLPCNVFMIFDCSYSGAFVSKGSIQSSLYKAVAKQNAAYAKTVGAAGNGKAKLHVLLATSHHEQAIATVPETGATKALTSAFVTALAKNATTGQLGMGGYSVNLYDLYKHIRGSVSTAGMYPVPVNGDPYPIYAIDEAYASN